METLTKIPRKIENPAKKSLDSAYFDFNDRINKIIGKSRVPAAQQEFMSKVTNIVPKKFRLDKNSGNPTLTNKKPYPKLNFIQKSLRKTTNLGIRGINKIIKIGKENLIDPFFTEYSNKARWVIFGDRVERDFETARNRGGLLMGRLLGAFSFMNYPKTWISNIFKYSTPRSIQKKAHNMTVSRVDKMHHPWDVIKGKSAKLFNRTIKPFYSKERWKKRKDKLKKVKAKTINLINKADKKVTNIPQKEELSLNPIPKKSAKVINLAEKNRIFREKLEDAA